MSGCVDNTYRVKIHHDTKEVELSSYGIKLLDLTVELGHYKSVDKLPRWMQERLAVLSMTKMSPPMVAVDGVGCRIGEYLYWVDPE